jgi:transglutaminase-like putative cysteine protease
VSATRLSWAVAGLLVLPWAAAAQAPRITPAGDPSVRSDSIYRLAVDPADHPDESAVYLLDDGVIVVQADGQERRTFRQVVQILKQDAVERYAEHSFSWSPDNEQVIINWIRVVRPDGSVVSAAPAQQQESDVPAEMGAPVYANRKVIRASMSGVAVGTIVDYSYTTIKKRSWVPGDFYQWWGVSTGLSVQRSRLIVDAPASEGVRIEERNLDFPVRTDRAGDREVRTWATGNLQRIKPEAFAADSNDVYMSVAIGSPLTWDDIGRWYGALAQDRYALPPDLAAKVRAMVSGARTARDTASIIQRWVAQDIRYVSISLGIGGYQPRFPAEVVSSGFGDCKDKATLFVAALRSLGFDAATVLANSSGGAVRALPSLQQFDHAIAYVTLPGGRIYTDLTVNVLPLGLLPQALQGEFGLAVPAAGPVEEVTFPQESPAERLSRVEFTGRVEPDGRVSGRYSEETTGARQWALRDAFSSPMDSAGRANFARRIAQSWFPGARGDSLKTFNGLNLAEPARISLSVEDGRALRRSGTNWILSNPVGSGDKFTDAADALEAEPVRRFPIDAARVFGPEVDVITFRLSLPAGWRPQLPPSVHASSVFGDYQADYTFTGGVLEVTRKMSGTRGIFPPGRIGELIAWFREVGADDAPFILIEPAPAP